MTTYAERSRVAALIDLGRGPDAIAEASRLLASTPDDPETLRLLARAHHVAGRPLEAVSWARRAVAAAPQDPRAHVVLSDALRKARAPQEAAEVAYSAVQLAPSDPSAMSVYALALADAGHRVEAETAARRMVSLSPSDPVAFLDLGYVLHRTKPKEARAAYEQCLRLDPSNALATQNLGALESRSSPLSAIDKFAASLAADPTLDIARRNLSSTLNRRLWLILTFTVIALQAVGRSGGRNAAPAVLTVLAVALAVTAYTWFRLPSTVRRAWKPLVLPGLSRSPWALRGLGAGLAIALAGCAWLVSADPDALLPGLVVGVGVVVMLVSLVGVFVAIREKRRTWS